MAQPYYADPYYADPEFAPEPAVQPQESQPQAAGNPWETSGAWTPKNWDELKAYARAAGWSEDFERWNNDQRTFNDWMQKWDPNARMFRSEKTDAQGNPLPGFVEKPMDTPEGWTAWGDHAVPTAEANQRVAGWSGEPGAGGGTALGASASGFGSSAPAPVAGPAPTFDWTRFEAPTFEDALNDPGYQFSLKQGVGALENSAAAKGMLRTGGTMKDILGYAQDRAAQQYSDVFGRKLAGAGFNFSGEQAAFAPKFGEWQSQFGAGEDRWRTQFGGDLAQWQTRFGGDLQKYLQKEGHIFGLLSSPPPNFPSGGGFNG